MRIYYSGNGSDWSEPEIAVGDDACIMLSFEYCTKKNGVESLGRRYRRIFGTRKKRKDKSCTSKNTKAS